MTLTSDDFVANAAAPLAPWAQALFGAPFAPLGRGPAFDCWGVVRAALAAQGLAAPSYQDAYHGAADTDRPALDALLSAEAAAWTPSPRVSAGVVLLCRVGRLRCHVAIACGAGRVLEAVDGAGVVLTEPAFSAHGVQLRHSWVEAAFVPSV